jgi:hypothetical protein
MKIWHVELRELACLLGASVMRGAPPGKERPQ